MFPIGMSETYKSTRYIYLPDSVVSMVLISVWASTQTIQASGKALKIQLNMCMLKEESAKAYSNVPEIVPRACWYDDYWAFENKERNKHTREWSPPKVTGRTPLFACSPTTFATSLVTRETVRGFLSMPMGGSSKLLCCSNWWWPSNLTFQPRPLSWSTRPASTRRIGPSSTPALGYKLVRR